MGGDLALETVAQGGARGLQLRQLLPRVLLARVALAHLALRLLRQQIQPPLERVVALALVLPHLLPQPQQRLLRVHAHLRARSLSP
eukprot:6485092-Pyramimonas_sp.AAC.1